MVSVLVETSEKANLVMRPGSVFHPSKQRVGKFGSEVWKGFLWVGM